MVFAKTESAKRDLQEQFAERLVHRHYVALVEGIAQSGRADHHLVEDKIYAFSYPKRRRRQANALRRHGMSLPEENMKPS